MSKEYAHYLANGPFFAGQNGYYLFPPANTVRIEYDSRAWFYSVERGELREFKAWVYRVFAENGVAPRITGKYPSYNVKSAGV